MRGFLLLRKQLPFSNTEYLKGGLTTKQVQAALLKKNGKKPESAEGARPALTLVKPEAAEWETA